MGKRINNQKILGLILENNSIIWQLIPKPKWWERLAKHAKTIIKYLITFIIGMGWLIS